MAALERIPEQRYADAIAHAFELLPALVGERLAHVKFLCADPIAAGLHTQEDTNDDRSLHDTAHICWAQTVERAAADRVTTVVLPRYYSNRETTAGVLVHELAHALHETLRWEPWPRPVSEYAQKNKYEAFAEAATAWWVPAHYGWPVGEWEREMIQRDDPGSAALFERLTRGEWR